MKNSNYNGLCNFNEIMYDLNENDIIINPNNIKLLNIFKKVSKDSITTIFKGRAFNINTNDKRLLNSKKGNKDKLCYVSVKQSKDRKMYINDLVLENKQKSFKVISPTAVKGAYSGFDKLFILNENEVHSDSYVSFFIKNRKEAESLKTYLNTKIVNKLLSIRKVSQTISKDTCKYILLVPFDRVWTDEKICKYFDLDYNKISKML